MQPTYLVFGGVNGAEKSTFFHTGFWRTDDLPTCLPRVNSDEIVVCHGGQARHLAHLRHQRRYPLESLRRPYRPPAQQADDRRPTRGARNPDYNEQACGKRSEGVYSVRPRAEKAPERRRTTMREKRQGSLLRLGLAAVLACGMLPAVALAEPEAQITQTPPPSSFLRS